MIVDLTTYRDRNPLPLGIRPVKPLPGDEDQLRGARGIINGIAIASLPWLVFGLWLVLK